MLTNIDVELFPNDCEVVEIPLHDLRIYLIHKNASSSLKLTAAARDWKFYRNDHIRTLDSIDIYIREPRSRLISGINTFVSHLMRDHDNLDRSTCEFLATRYLFMNRHYLPQWHWLVNLARFVRTDCKFRMHRLDELESIIDIKSRAGISPLSTRDSERMLEKCGNVDLWLMIDQILLDCCGQHLTWQEILDIYNQHPARPLEIITRTHRSVSDVLP